MAQETVNFERHKYIGGSDIPIIMNLSPFKTRMKLLREKAQIEEDNFVGNEFTTYGNIMEPKIREYINKSLGFDFQEGKAYGEGVRIHTDGEDILKDCILEVKTTSRIKDQIEDYKIYLVQLLFYMNERDMNNGILAVYDRPDDLNEEFDYERLMTYPIVRNDYQDLIAEIYEEVDLFRQDLVKVKQNPFITEEELLPEDTRILTHRLINMKERERYFDDMKDERANLEAMVGQLLTRDKRKTAEIGGYKVTWTPPKEAVMQTKEKPDLKLLKLNYPAAYKHCVLIEEKMGGARKGSITLTRLKE